jgi:hypothetical protein
VRRRSAKAVWNRRGGIRWGTFHSMISHTIFIVQLSIRKTYRVHVPEALGSVIPEIDSIKDDFPALC